MQKIQQLLELKRLYLERMSGRVFVDLSPIKPSHLQMLPMNGQKNHSLQEIAHDITKCHLCELSKLKRTPHPGYTPQRPWIAFVSETPLNAHPSSSVLTTRSGEMLQDMIDHVLTLPITEVGFLSLLKCQPLLGQDMPQECIDMCLPYLFDQISLMQPKLIVALGDKVFKAFFKTHDHFESVRGKMQTWENIPLIALYSPKHLLRNPSLKKTTMRDLIYIKSLISRK